MMAHVLLSQARSAPKDIVAHTSELIDPWRSDQVKLTVLEYDKVAPGTKTKEWYYTEAAQNLNKADEAFRTAGPGAIEEEPVSLAMGKSKLAY
jgi:hypothetical protein